MNGARNIVTDDLDAGRARSRLQVCGACSMCAWVPGNGACLVFLNPGHLDSKTENTSTEYRETAQTHVSFNLQPLSRGMRL